MKIYKTVTFSLANMKVILSHMLFTLNLRTNLQHIVSGTCFAAGGFKLWECAVDLAQYLCREYSLDKLVTSKTDPNFELVGKRVLELGCGQGLPGIVPLLAGAEVHFQASPSRYLT